MYPNMMVNPTIPTNNSHPNMSMVKPLPPSTSVTHPQTQQQSQYPSWLAKEYMRRLKRDYEETHTFEDPTIHHWNVICPRKIVNENEHESETINNTVQCNPEDINILAHSDRCEPNSISLHSNSVSDSLPHYLLTSPNQAIDDIEDFESANNRDDDDEDDVPEVRDDNHDRVDSPTPFPALYSNNSQTSTTTVASSQSSQSSQSSSSMSSANSKLLTCLDVLCMYDDLKDDDLNNNSDNSEYEDDVHSSMDEEDEVLPQNMSTLAVVPPMAPNTEEYYSNPNSPLIAHKSINNKENVSDQNLVPKAQHQQPHPHQHHHSSMYCAQCTGTAPTTIHNNNMHTNGAVVSAKQRQYSEYEMNQYRIRYRQWYIEQQKYLLLQQQQQAHYNAQYNQYIAAMNNHHHQQRQNPIHQSYYNQNYANSSAVNHPRHPSRSGA